MISETSKLLEALYYADQSVRKIEILTHYLKLQTHDAPTMLWMLLGGFELKKVSTRRLKTELTKRIDPQEFQLSHSFVKHLPDTLSRLWVPLKPIAQGCLDVDHLVTVLSVEHNEKRAQLLIELLDSLSDLDRWIVINLATKNPWILSKRIILESVASHMGIGMDRVESRWHAIEVDYRRLGGWLESGSNEIEMFAEGAFFSGWPRIDEVFLEQGKEIPCSEINGDWFSLPKGNLFCLVVTDIESRIYDSDGEEVAHLRGWIDSIKASEGIYFVLEILNSTPNPEILWVAKKQGDLWISDGFPDGSMKPETLNSKTMSTRTAKSKDLLLFVPADCEQPWVRLREEKRQLNLGLMYFFPGERGEPDILTLGLPDPGLDEWMSLVSIPMKTHPLDDLAFADWKKANKTRRSGPVIEVKKTLVVKISYDAVAMNPRRKCGLDFLEAEFEAICWHTSVASLPNFSSWRETLSQS
jgi:hypothetical protein